MTQTALALVLALALDYWWGEPRRWHPLVGFGRLAIALEKSLNRGDGRIRRGLFAWSLLVLPLCLVAVVVRHWSKALPQPLPIFIQALFVYAALGLKSLGDHADSVSVALHAEDLPQARRALSMMVSRDTQSLNSTAISRATAESVLENGSDAVMATLFWFCVAGIPGVMLHRLANTLDAMWGYRTPRYNEFGRVAARVDDALNFIPARLTALAYALVGNPRDALQCWYTQARAWGSPNAGPVMAAGAGALGLRLGGVAQYAGAQEARSVLGCGREPAVGDIARAIGLVHRAALLFVALIAVFAWLV